MMRERLVPWGGGPVGAQRRGVPTSRDGVGCMARTAHPPTHPPTHTHVCTAPATRHPGQAGYEPQRYLTKCAALLAAAALSAQSAAHFIVMVGVHVLQSRLMVALVQSRVKTPELGAVSWHSSVGVP